MAYCPLYEAIQRFISTSTAELAARISTLAHMRMRDRLKSRLGAVNTSQQSAEPFSVPCKCEQNKAQIKASLVTCLSSLFIKFYRARCQRAPKP